MELKNKNMETRNNLLKELGFSENFINVIENSSNENIFDNIDQTFSCYDSIGIIDSDFTSLIIEKSEEPLNFNSVFSDY